MEDDMGTVGSVGHNLGYSSLSGDAETLLCYRPDPERLFHLAMRNRAAFRGSQPFPHVVIDGLFPEIILDQVVNEVPKRWDGKWRKWGSGSSLLEDAEGIKMGISREFDLGALRTIVNLCQDHRAVNTFRCGNSLKPIREPVCSAIEPNAHCGENDPILHELRVLDN
jgi:hypothetical protein